MIIFVAVAFAFMSLYDRFYVQPQAATQTATQTEARRNAESAAPNVPNAAPTSASVEAPRAVQSADRVLANVKTAIGDLTIDELGRISQATLSGVVFKGEDSEQTRLFDSSVVRPLEVRFRDGAIKDQAFSVAYVASSETIDASEGAAELTLTQTLSDLTIVKKLTFYPDGHYDLLVTPSREVDFFLTPGSRPVAASDPMTIQGSLVHTANGTIETVQDGDAKGNEAFSKAKMVSSFDRYYVSLFYNYENPIDISFLKTPSGDSPLPFVWSKSDLSVSGYIGPKYVDKLRAINPNLTAAVEYGFFTFLSKPLFVVLEWIYALVPSWGWSIVLFTLLVKIVLFPLSYKGMLSMSRLKDLAPKMKELQEKYKDDKQKLQVHMMELYKKHGANPLGGCLPLVLQIPIFFAIYRILLNAIELKGAEWLYIGDLSLKDPIYVLPLLMGATMWFQQRITPSNFTDPMQEKIFKWLPVIFTVFFLFFPAGLVLYWLVNNIVSIGQQWFVNKRIKAIKESRKE
jgi:YidC/Oxa1 family membrane protein insertase